MTFSGHNVSEMRNLRKSRLGTGLLLVAAAVVAAASLAGISLALPQPVASYFFGPTMVRAEVILMAKDGVRDLRLDRGRIRALTPTAVTLKERDGLIVTVPIAPSARVHVNGRAMGGIFALRRGMEAVIVQDGESGVAESVYAVSKRDASSFAVPRPFMNHLFGASMMRTEAVLKTATGFVDYRIDRGRVRSVGPSSVTLRERDGLVVTVPVAAGARIQVNGRLSGLAGLKAGMEAMTIRDGNRPADTIQVPPRR